MKKMNKMQGIRRKKGGERKKREEERTGTREDKLNKEIWVIRKMQNKKRKVAKNRLDSA